MKLTIILEEFVSLLIMRLNNPSTAKAKGVKFGRPEAPTPDGFDKYISKWEKG